MANAEQLASNASRLATLPEVYLRARRALQSDDSSLAEIADIIACDPGMTSRLLRVANSAFFGFVAQVQTVARAINILGTQQVHDLLLATSVSEVFRGVPEELVDDPETAESLKPHYRYICKRPCFPASIFTVTRFLSMTMMP